MIVAEIMDKFILELDVLRAYDGSVDLRFHLLLLGQDVTLRKSGAEPTSATK